MHKYLYIQPEITHKPTRLRTAICFPIFDNLKIYGVTEVLCKNEKLKTEPLYKISFALDQELAAYLEAKNIQNCSF